MAYNLGGWGNVPFAGDQPLTAEQVTKEADTFASARLWDPRPLRTTLDQLQTVRKYYDFTGVDTDRYRINGVPRQVMLSARELALAQNPNASGWVNQRIRFTHGVGAAMVPVNEIGSEGQPKLLISNLPPTSAGGAPTIDPAHSGIYFGERPSSYVVVGAQQNEFDYPTGESDTEGSIGTETRWTGTTGVALDNALMRLLFAARFRDLDLLISNQVTASSQLLFHRSLNDRLSLIAPFLRLDKDPYLVINDAGRMIYVQDAYTTSDRFPNAQRFVAPDGFDLAGLKDDDFDYIRNSVKITVDAYDGTMHFYVNDPTDPIIRAYQGVFPSLFEPLSAMPTDLAAHLRVPEDLFNVQTTMFGRYHVTNTQQFFGADDLWTVPVQTSEQTLPSEAYYVEMRLPNESGVEFLLLQPMVPTGRPNMIAWVAARMDAPNYGQVQVYRFPADTTIFGPAQIEARIDQDPLISAQVSLWNQSGSKVIRGSLIVVPLDDALIYLQPVYLQSTGSAFPEFTRIVVASPRQVVWAATLGDALRLLLAAEAGAPPGPVPTPTPGPSPTPGPGATPGPTPGATPGTALPADVPGSDRVRQRPFRARPERAARRRLRPLRHRDRAGAGRPPATPGPRARERGTNPGGVDQPRAVSRGGGWMTALLVTLATPATWPLALATFLVRGGVVLVLLPIVVLPTTVGLGTAFGPTLTSVAFGSVPLQVIVVAGAVGLVAVAWVVVGGWLAAALEAEGSRIVARDEEVVALGAVGGISCGRDGDILQPGRGADPRGAADRVCAARRCPGPGFDPPGPRDLPGAHQSARREHAARASGPARHSRGRRRRGPRLDARRDRRGHGCPADRLERCGRRRSTRRCRVGPRPGAPLVHCALRDPDDRPVGDPRARGRRGQLGVGGGRDGPGRCGGAAPVASDGRRVRRLVGGGIGPRRGRLRLASGHLDRRRGHSEGDVRGVHRPPTGSLAAHPLVCDAVARSVLGPVPTAR